MVVIVLHTNQFNGEFGSRKFEDIRKKAPVVFFETRKIEIAEDITQKNEPPERVLLQHFYCIGCPAEPRAQMRVGNNDGIERRCSHLPLLPRAKASPPRRFVRILLSCCLRSRFPVPPFPPSSPPS